ncbi:MAG TPA: hypothetical protein VII38_08680 [Polyangia bacterium]
MRLSLFVALTAALLASPAFADASIAPAGAPAPLVCRPESALPRPYAKMNRPAILRVGAKRIGTLAIDEAHHALSAILGQLSWRAPIPEVFADSLDAIVDGDQVIVALYSPATGGAALISFELASGKRRWTAEVAELAVAHSEYWNVVTIEKRKDEIVLRGDEAGGCTVQIFDAKTGKRRLNLQHRKW